MFTGIIESTGIIHKAVSSQGNRIFTVSAPAFAQDLSNGESVCINGVCLTVTNFTSRYFSVDAVRETLTKSTLGNLHTGMHVNLERSLRPTDRLGGHFVQGHTDGKGVIEKIEAAEGSTLITFRLSEELMTFCVAKGSIAIDGLSLTVVNVHEFTFTTSIIPYTLEHTTAKNWRIGGVVNIEVDILAKYVRNFLTKTGETSITKEWLEHIGFVK